MVSMTAAIANPCDTDPNQIELSRSKYSIKLIHYYKITFKIDILTANTIFSSVYKSMYAYL